MASFWRNLIYGDKLSNCMYKLLFSLKQNGVYTFKWLNFIESIFNDTGMGYVFANQDDSDYKLLLEQILQDQYIQKWHHDMQLSSRGKFYSTFKENLCFEKYLIKIPYNLKIWITKLRTSNLKIPIETGRWRNIPVLKNVYVICAMKILETKFIIYLFASLQN